jgi:hypothetical protein
MRSRPAATQLLIVDGGRSITCCRSRHVYVCFTNYPYSFVSPSDELVPCVPGLLRNYRISKALELLSSWYIANPVPR